jgi:hypothetical protein
MRNYEPEKMTKSEEWRPIPGWSDLYEVSSYGRVRSLTRTIEQVGKGGTVYTRRYAGRVLTAKPNLKGYPDLHLCRDGKKTAVEIHRLVALAFHGECPEGCEVLHLDESRDNNAASNLEYGTHVRNMRESRRAKLTADEAREIRAAASGNPDCWHELASQYGVTRANVRAIAIGLSWRTL